MVLSKLQHSLLRLSLCGVILGHIFMAWPLMAQQCKSCHQEVEGRLQSSRYVHPPLYSASCAHCHQPEQADPAAGGAEQPQPLAWLAQDGVMAQHHWLQLPGQLAGALLVLEAESGLNSQRHELQAPPLAEVSPLPEDEGPPEVYGLRLVELTKGVLISARLRWYTSQLSQTRASYGEQGPTTPASSPGGWGLEHEIVLAGLAPDQSYSFRAEAVNLQGQQGNGAQLSFATGQAIAPAEPAGEAGADLVQLKSHWWRHGDQLFLQLEAEQPCSVKVGQKEAQSLPATDNHPALRQRQQLTITVCYECHPQTKGAMSHPVGVRPKSTMAVDPRRLVDGKLSCMSCHEPHGSANRYRLLTKTKKELCLSCHNFQ